MHNHNIVIFVCRVAAHNFPFLAFCFNLLVILCLVPMGISMACNVFFLFSNVMFLTPSKSIKFKFKLCERHECKTTRGSII